MTHNVIKVIKKRYSHFLCDECNTSYPSLKSMLENHKDAIPLVREMRF